MRAVSPRVFLPAGMILGAALLVLLVRFALPPPESPVPAPDPRLAEDYADPDEDAVLEVEDALVDLALQLKARAWGGAMYHVADDFEGGPFLRDPEGERRDVGGVSLASSGPDARRLDRAGFRASLEGLELRDVVFKLPRATLRDGSLQARLKIDARDAIGTRHRRRVSEGDAEFVRRGARWVLRRFRSERQLTEEGELRFHDVTVPLGLPTEPGCDDRESASLTFGRLFLGGIAAGDYDGDGDVDLYVPLVGPDLLLRREGGRFVDRAAESGIADGDAGAGALFLDVDNDGDLDLWVTNYEPEGLRDRKTGALCENVGRRALALYRNDGGRFTDVTEAAGLSGRGPAMSACAADVDRDGDLDVFVARYRDDSVEDPRFSEEVPPTVWDARDGVADQLWINDGSGRFREEGAARGVADRGWGLAAGFADYDGDGDADLYVANDYGANRLFRNRGDGRFDDVTLAAGVEDRGFGMGVTWLDYDGDGRLDLYVSNMYSTAGNRLLARGPGRLPGDAHERLLRLARGNSLFRNRGDGGFEDVTAKAGAGRAGWAWSSAAYDYDNDRRPDLYVANGFRTSPYVTADI
jgi:hypothetical protein